ncbi:MAG: hypothetical protein ACT6FE_06175 [Methanosarcinaceae archaeon]
MASNQFEVNLQVFKGLKIGPLVADGIPRFTFALCEAFKVDGGTLTIIGESDLQERDGLIGMSGAYFHPSLLSASSCGEVFDAWEWIGKEVGDYFYQMSQLLTGAFVLRAIMTGLLNFAVMAPIGMAVKLHKLSKSIDTKPKVKELKRFMRGNVKSYDKDQLKWYGNMDERIRFLCNLDAEFEFALFSLECGLSVRLKNHPDILLEGIPVDIKNPSWDRSLPTHNYTRKVIEHAEGAFQEQDAKLVGLSIGMALIMLGLSKERTSKNRIGREEFCMALKKGLILAKDERKPVLLFYHDPWTGDVQAITETMEDLMEDLGGF